METNPTVEPMAFIPEMSTDSICYREQTSVCVSDVIDGKAPLNHTHNEYAPSSHTHTGYAASEHTHDGYAASSHTHAGLESAIDALNTGKAPVTHSHAQSEVTGLADKLTEIDTAIAALQAAGNGNEVAPMLTASMHLGKLDNNNGAELYSTTRICSDPFAVENGKSYWQVNDKGVNMYVLLYDADETFLQYVGNMASGAEIVVNNASAAYMRLSSLVGEYDLTNEFRIYNRNPNASTEDPFTQEDADLLYAPINHTHTGFAAAEHTHDYAPTVHTHDYAAPDHTHTGFAATAHTHTASEITGLPASVDAYNKTESDARYAQVAHTHADYVTDEEAVDAFAGVNHTHTGFAAADHTHTGFAAADHTHTGFAAANHGHSYNDLEDKPTIPTIPASLPADGGNADTVDGKHATDFATAGHSHTPAAIGAAPASHEHDGYAPAAHTHTPASIGAASASHTHSSYAASNHGHIDYADAEHTHTADEVGAIPSTGGTFTGPVTVTPYLYTAQIMPKDGGSYSIGSSENRYYSTYLRVNPNVSSDRRLKRDIYDEDIAALAAFVDKLQVVSYNYIDDAEDADERIGLIAQDVVAADPDIAKGCVEQDEKGFYSLRTADLVYPLIAAVQALTQRVEDLEGK